MDYIYFLFKNYNTIYLIYNVLFLSIYIFNTLKTIKEIKDDWIFIHK